MAAPLRYNCYVVFGKCIDTIVAERLVDTIYFNFAKAFN